MPKFLISLIQPKYHNIWEPLWAGYLKAYCDKYGNEKHQWQLLHGNFDEEEDIILKAPESDLVVFSATTPVFQNVVDLTNKIKNLNKIWSCKKPPKIIVGGWNVTSDNNINEDIRKLFDGIFFGEGEKPFCNAINNFNKLFNNNEKTKYSTTPATFEELPWPDRGFIQQERFLQLCQEMCGERIASVQSIRGCKFNCKMCSEYCMTKNNIRIRNPVDTLDEIEYLIKDYKIDRVKFVDPTWAISEKAVNDFCEEKIKRNCTIKFDAMVHASIATENMLKIMSEANCDVIMVGVESGDQRLLNEMKKGVALSKIEKVFKWGKKYNINRRAFFILGNPLEDNLSIENTRKFIYKLQPDIVGFTVLTPYPGNDYFREEFRDYDWSNADEYNNDFWYTKNFTNEELKNIQKSLNKEFEDIVVSHQKYKIGE